MRREMDLSFLPRALLLWLFCSVFLFLLLSLVIHMYIDSHTRTLTHAHSTTHIHAHTYTQTAALFFATEPTVLLAATASSPTATSDDSSFLMVGELPPQIHLLTLQVAIVYMLIYMLYAHTYLRERITHQHLHTPTTKTKHQQKLPHHLTNGKKNAPAARAQRVLLRLAHQYALGEDAAALSQPATVSLRGCVCVCVCE